MTEQRDKQNWYQQILRDTQGMTQEQRWEYYDKHPGSHEVVWELRHKDLLSEFVGDFNATAKALGVNDEVEAIDQATERLDVDSYTKWLENHPSAKQTLIKIQEAMDKRK